MTKNLFYGFNIRLNQVNILGKENADLLNNRRCCPLYPRTVLLVFNESVPADGLWKKERPEEGPSDTADLWKCAHMAQHRSSTVRSRPRHKDGALGHTPPNRHSARTVLWRVCAADLYAMISALRKRGSSLYSLNCDVFIFGFLFLVLIANGVHLTESTVKRYIELLIDKELITDGWSLAPSLQCNSCKNFFTLPNEIFLLKLLPRDCCPSISFHGYQNSCLAPQWWVPPPEGTQANRVHNFFLSLLSSKP